MSSSPDDDAVSSALSREEDSEDNWSDILAELEGEHHMKGGKASNAKIEDAYCHNEGQEDSKEEEGHSQRQINLWRKVTFHFIYS